MNIGSCQWFTCPAPQDFNRNYCRYLPLFCSMGDSRRQVLFIKQEVNTVLVRNAPQRKGNVGKKRGQGLDILPYLTSRWKRVGGGIMIYLALPPKSFTSCLQIMSWFSSPPPALPPVCARTESSEWKWEPQELMTAFFRGSTTQSKIIKKKNQTKKTTHVKYRYDFSLILETFGLRYFKVWSLLRFLLSCCNFCFLMEKYLVQKFMLGLAK